VRFDFLSYINKLWLNFSEVKEWWLNIVCQSYKSSKGSIPACNRSPLFFWSRETFWCGIALLSSFDQGRHSGVELLSSLSTRGRRGLDLENMNPHAQHSGSISKASGAYGYEKIVVNDSHRECNRYVTTVSSRAHIDFNRSSNFFKVRKWNRLWLMHAFSALDSWALGIIGGWEIRVWEKFYFGPLGVW